MGGKKLISLLLALALCAALLPAPAHAWDGPYAVALQDDPAQSPEGEETIAQEEAEAAPLPYEEEPAPDPTETPQEDLLSLIFTLPSPADPIGLSLTDADGALVEPLSDGAGAVLYGQYLLHPGVYAYAFHDEAGGFEDVPSTVITLEETALRTEIALHLSARSEERPRFPVVFRGDGLGDFSALTVRNGQGAVMEPYTDPATGETQYQNYLLPCGEYSYLYRDAEGRFEDLEGSFTVEEGGVQYVTLTRPELGVGMCFTGTMVNPCYAGLIREEEIPESPTSPEQSLARLLSDVGAVAGPATAEHSIAAVFGASSALREESSGGSPVTYDNSSAAGEALKRGLIQRQENVTIRIVCQFSPTEELWWQLCEMVYNSAIRHNRVPTEGDYLRYEYGGVRCTGSAVGPDTHGDSYYEFNYSPLYFTTHEQETELSARVESILSGLKLAGKSDEQKIRAIYDYLCSHVSYLYTDDNLVFTAYGALVRGSAACQGISVAFYRLCLELGVDARVVTSAEMGHSWNIACVDGAHFYALDATWDLGSSPDERAYFLKGRESWLSDHSLGDEFENGKFSGYAFPDEDYDSVSEALIHSVSLLFDGMLRIKYYFVIPDRLLSMPDARIQFCRDGETVLTVPLAEAKVEKGYCCYYCSVPAEEIGTPVQARIVDGYGEAVCICSESGTAYPNGFFFSAMKYASEMKTAGSTAAMRALAQALEDYGAAAQNYFKKTGGEIRGEVAAVTAEDLAAWTAVSEGEKPAGFRGVSLSVLFEADNSLRVYVHVSEGHDPSDYSYEIDGRPALLYRKSDGSCYLCVENIAANHLDDAHRFTISDGNDRFTLTASVVSYAKISIERGDSDAASLGKALYLYNRAAESYFGA